MAAAALDSGGGAFSAGLDDMTTKMTIVAATLVAALVAGASGARAQEVQAHVPAPVLVDHHVHVHSPRIMQILLDGCARTGRACTGFAAPVNADDLLADMDAAGIRTALVMSSGYLMESPRRQPPLEDAADILRDANDFTVGLARSHPGRLAAFIGVNPFTPTAMPEIRRWIADPAVSGVKIHMGNSEGDFRKPEHVAALQAVFREAGAADLAVMIHMRTHARDPLYGAQDVRIFLEQVLPMAGGAPVQVAHAGGWGGGTAAGGAGPLTMEALETFASMFAERPELGANLYFDLSGVFDEETPPGILERQAELIRSIGVSHFLAASDWADVRDLRREYSEVYPVLPLSDAEWDMIRSNRLPYRRGL